MSRMDEYHQESGTRETVVGRASVITFKTAEAWCKNPEWVTWLMPAGFCCGHVSVGVRRNTREESCVAPEEMVLKLRTLQEP